MPSILYGAGRRLAGLVLILAISACGRAKIGPSGEVKAARAGQPTDRVRVFLIAPADGGRTGHKVACGDSALPVEIALPHPEPGLEGALHALLALRGRYHEPSGLYNALDPSSLELVRIERQGAEARIYLKGYLETGDKCENPRILAELQETALQFSDVSHVQFYLADQPLQQLLSGN